MLACVDVHYHDVGARAACLLFSDWADAVAARQCVVDTPAAGPYEPGRFYLRELPCVLAVLGTVAEPLEGVVIDGYVWLDAGRTPGLGGHLHVALGGSIPVIGVAKSAYRGATWAVPVFRGRSRTPLYVTAAGMAALDAAACVRRMHGPYRIPTLLRAVDRLCRRG